MKPVSRRVLSLVSFLCDNVGCGEMATIVTADDMTAPVGWFREIEDKRYYCSKSCAELWAGRRTPLGPVMAGAEHISLDAFRVSKERLEA